MFIICSHHRPSHRSPGRRSDGPGQGPVKPESAGFSPIPGKTRGFLADTIVGSEYSTSIAGRVHLSLSQGFRLSDPKFLSPSGPQSGEIIPRMVA